MQPPNEQELADARIRFLTSETVERGEVRDAIRTSWWRSRQSQVPADRIEVPYFDEQDLSAPWIRSAEPLLRRLDEQLDGQPVSIILTDSTGAVVSQHTGDAALRRHLEAVHLLPGFSYGERFVGTNGIGTALEEGQPSEVYGHEHYAEHLESLACAGVPIQHPISGKTVGLVDLTCWRRDASGLLIALARSTTEQIRQALLASAGVHELELFQEYLRACRRTGGIVIALNDSVVMMNDYARELLEPGDQSMLLGRAKQAFAEAERVNISLHLPSGNKVRVHGHRISGSTSASRIGGVVHVELVAADSEPETSGTLQRLFLPGTVSSAPLWLRCCHEVDASYDRAEWVALVGEPGTGKRTLAECVHRRRRPSDRLRIFDAAEATDIDWVDNIRRELDDEQTTAVVIRRVDQLDGGIANELATTLIDIRGREQQPTPWIALTLTPGTHTDPNVAQLLAMVPRTVEVPPLRYHLEDIRQLVPYFLNKLSRAGQLTCSPAAMKLLMRATWPGNVEELYQVLKNVATHRRRIGSIQPNDLPPEYHAVTRRALSQLESIERDAIVQALRDADGNKAQAAKLIGMSRATIYRKIHEYGIVTPERTR